MKIIKVDSSGIINDPMVVKVLVGFTQEWFIETIKEVGIDRIESEKIYCILFHDMPPEDIELKMPDYSEVFSQIPYSEYIWGRSMYIGNIGGKRMDVVNSILDSLFKIPEVYDNFLAFPDFSRLRIQYEYLEG